LHSAGELVFGMSLPLELPKLTSRAGDLMDAARAGHWSEVETLVGKGVRVDGADEDGYTALHYAARWGDTRAIGLLLDRGADVDAKSRFGVSPLFLAAMNGPV